MLGGVGAAVSDGRGYPMYARHGRDWNGVQVPCTRLGVSRSSAYQMTTPIDKVLDEGNCGRATDRGEEACERVRKRWVCLSPPRRVLIKAARLRDRNVIQGRNG